MDNVLLRLGLELGIFDILAKSTGSLDVARLAKETGVADQTLLSRILRALGSMNAVGEVGIDTYMATNFTRAFTSLKGICGAKFS